LTNRLSLPFTTLSMLLQLGKEMLWVMTNG
jgi:hypothetical protein